MAATESRSLAAADTTPHIYVAVSIWTMVPCAPGAAPAASEAAAAIASRAVRQQIAAPVAAALREWRRTLRVPVASVQWGRPAVPPVVHRRREGHYNFTTPAVAAATVAADPWALATAPWRTAAAVRSGLVLRRIWSLSRQTPAVLRSSRH